MTRRFERVTAQGTLLKAIQRVVRGKRHLPDVARFVMDAEGHGLALSRVRLTCALCALRSCMPIQAGKVTVIHVESWNGALPGSAVSVNIVDDSTTERLGGLVRLQT